MSPADYVPRLGPGEPEGLPVERVMGEPGLHGAGLKLGERIAPPPMPPGFCGTVTCCPQCPYAACERCEPAEAWAEYRRVLAERRELAESNRRAASWWRRLIAASWPMEEYQR